MTNAADETDYLFDQAFWDAQYRTRSQLWSGRPNGHLVAQAAELPAGAALDVGSGEGADAIWLAERGWGVTAVDVSAVALERGAQHAAEAGTEVAAQIAWHHEDVRTWAPEPSSYDLVSAQFMHLMPPDRTALIGRLAAAVAPGGALLVVVTTPPTGRPPFPAAPGPSSCSPPPSWPPSWTRSNGRSCSPQRRGGTRRIPPGTP